MKNIIQNFDSSESICKSNSIEGNSNCSLSSNEDIKPSLNCSKSTNCSNNINLSSNKEKKININKNKKIFIPKSVNNEKNIEEKNKNENKIYITENISIKNDFNINNEIFKDNYCKDWIINGNDIIPSIMDFSLKKENINENNNNYFNLKNKYFSFQNISNFDEIDNDFSLKYKKDDFCLNNIINEKKDEGENDNNKNKEENEDCCSKMTNLYCQDYYDKKELLNF